MYTFPGNNTAQGFFSYYHDLTAAASRVFLLKGGPGTGKSTLMRRVAQHFQDAGQMVDLHLCSGDPHSLDAVSIPALGTLIADATSPHPIEPSAPGLREDIIALGDYWNRTQLLRDQSAILALDTQRRAAYRTAYALLREAMAARSAVDEALQPAIAQLRSEVQRCYNEMCALLKTAPPEAHPTHRHCFYTAITYCGQISIAPTLDGTTALVAVNNPSWSELVANIEYTCRLQGISTLLLADPLHPIQWEGIYLPSLNRLYIKQPAEGTTTGGLYEEAMLRTLRTQPLWADLSLPAPDTVTEVWQLREIQRIQDAQTHLTKAHDLHTQIESHYSPAMDFSGVADCCYSIIEEIESLPLK